MANAAAVSDPWRCCLLPLAPGVPEIRAVVVALETSGTSLLLLRDVAPKTL